MDTSMHRKYKKCSKFQHHWVDTVLHFGPIWYQWIWVNIVNSNHRNNLILVPSFHMLPYFPSPFFVLNTSKNLHLRLRFLGQWGWMVKFWNFHWRQGQLNFQIFVVILLFTFSIFQYIFVAFFHWQRKWSANCRTDF